MNEQHKCIPKRYFFLLFLFFKNWIAVKKKIITRLTEALLHKYDVAAHFLDWELKTSAVAKTRQKP